MGCPKSDEGASVFFAASYSATGASRELFRLAQMSVLQLVVSEVVLEEVRRNLKAKAPTVVPLFESLLQAVPHTVVDANEAEVRQVAQYTAHKDAPIVAAAKAAKADCLVSLDRRHLVGVSEVARCSGLRIVLPGDLL
ncbi:MAG: PIN domain-containing protein, partial [Caldilineales bacterium]|nr:PIN domain-containing protein [Caldilineales bacterium]